MVFFSESLDDLFEVLQEQEVMCMGSQPLPPVVPAPTRKKRTACRSKSSPWDAVFSFGDCSLGRKEGEEEAMEVSSSPWNEGPSSSLCSAVEAAEELTAEEVMKYINFRVFFC